MEKAGTPDPICDKVIWEREDDEVPPGLGADREQVYGEKAWVEPPVWDGDNRVLAR